MASDAPPTSTVHVKAETPPAVDVFSTLRKDLDDALSNPLVDDIRFPEPPPAAVRSSAATKDRHRQTATILFTPDDDVIFDSTPKNAVQPVIPQSPPPFADAAGAAPAAAAAAPSTPPPATGAPTAPPPNVDAAATQLASLALGGWRPPQEARAVVFTNEVCGKHRYVREPEDPHFEIPARLQYLQYGLDYLRRIAGDALVMRETQRTADLLKDPVVTAVHEAAYVAQLTQLARDSLELIRTQGVEVPEGWSKGDLYICPESLDAWQAAIGAVYDGIDLVCRTAVTQTFVAVRPPGHHAACSMPAGFCFLNNVVCGAVYAARQYGIKHVAIIDFDLHHGDGTQAIVRQLSVHQPAPPGAAPSTGVTPPSMFYGSLHDILSYPTEVYDDEKVSQASMCVMAHGVNIWNVHLEHYKNMSEYEQLYQNKYLGLLRQADKFFAKHKPSECLLMVSAGFDAHEGEYPGMQRHKIWLPDVFYYRFTQELMELANKRCMGRMVSVLEGGYSRDALSKGISRHVGAMLGVSEADSKLGHQRARASLSPSLYARTPPPDSKAGPAAAAGQRTRTGGLVNRLIPARTAATAPVDRTGGPSLVTTRSRGRPAANANASASANANANANANAGPAPAVAAAAAAAAGATASAKATAATPAADRTAAPAAAGTATAPRTRGRPAAARTVGPAGVATPAAVASPPRAAPQTPTANLQAVSSETVLVSSELTASPPPVEAIAVTEEAREKLRELVQNPNAAAE